MWCSKCHYGAKHVEPGRCPQCAGYIDEANDPLPKEPMPQSMGSGFSTGKTRSKRERRVSA